MKKSIFDILLTVVFLFCSIAPLFYVMPAAYEQYPRGVHVGVDGSDLDVPSDITIVYEDYAKKYSPDDALGDVSCFANSAFLGNSHAQALKNYALLPDADFYTKVGLSVLNVIKTSDGSTPVLSGLYNKKYDNVFFMFGENELGWPYPKNFINEYEKIIEAARKILPDADFYIQSIFPVSLSVSSTSTNGITNANVEKYNDMLAQMASEYDGVYFINPARAVRDKNGNLPEEASTDGMHFNIGYCKIWVNYLIDHMNTCKLENGEEETADAMLAAEPEITTAAPKSETVTIVYYETSATQPFSESEPDTEETSVPDTATTSATTTAATTVTTTDATTAATTATTATTAKIS